MKTIFKVGDRVFDIRFGWGEVINIDGHVNVHFDVDYDTDYYKDGRHSIYEKNPTLSFTEYTLQGFSQERPKKEPEIGSLCLFSDNKDELNNNIGHINVLELISTGIYKYSIKGGVYFRYCKQIKIEEI